MKLSKYPLCWPLCMNEEKKMIRKKKKRKEKKENREEIELRFCIYIYIYIYICPFKRNKIWICGEKWKEKKRGYTSENWASNHSFPWIHAWILIKRSLLHHLCIHLSLIPFPPSSSIFSWPPFIINDSIFPILIIFLIYFLISFRVLT